MAKTKIPDKENKISFGWLSFQFIGPFSGNKVKVFLKPEFGGHLIGEIDPWVRDDFRKDLEELEKKYFTNNPEPKKEA